MIYSDEDLLTWMFFTSIKPWKVIPLSTLQACEVFFCFLDAEPCFMKENL